MLADKHYIGGEVEMGLQNKKYCTEFKITDSLLESCELMLHELANTRLRVVLVPIADGRKIRKSVETNPTWYRILCSMHPCGRQKMRARKLCDTRIRRREALNALERMSDGNWNSQYAEMLAPYVVEWDKRNGQW